MALWSSPSYVGSHLSHIGASTSPMQKSREDPSNLYSTLIRRAAFRFYSPPFESDTACRGRCQSTEFVETFHGAMRAAVYVHHTAFRRGASLIREHEHLMERAEMVVSCQPAKRTRLIKRTLRAIASEIGPAFLERKKNAGTLWSSSVKTTNG